MRPLYQKQLFGTDGFVILTQGANPGHLTRLDDKGAFPREYAGLFIAAPDLLEALEGIMIAIAKCGIVLECMGKPVPLIELLTSESEAAAVDAARAALAAAKGDAL